MLKRTECGNGVERACMRHNFALRQDRKETAQTITFKFLISMTDRTENETQPQEQPQAAQDTTDSTATDVGGGSDISVGMYQSELRQRTGRAPDGDVEDSCPSFLANIPASIWDE